MGKLRAHFVIHFADRTECRPRYFCERQGHAVPASFTEHEMRKLASQNSPWSYPPAIVTVDANRIRPEAMQAWQMIVRHTDVAVPLGLDLDFLQLRERPTNITPGPTAMDRKSKGV